MTVSEGSLFQMFEVRREQDAEEAYAIPQRERLDPLHVRREGEACNGRAAREGAAANFCHAFQGGKVDGRDGRAGGEGGASDGSQGHRQLDGLEGGAAAENALGEVHDALRYVHLPQGLAADEGALPQLRYAEGYVHVQERSALGERPVADDLQRHGQVRVPEPLAARKGTLLKALPALHSCVQTHNAFRNYSGRDFFVPEIFCTVAVTPNSLPLYERASGGREKGQRKYGDRWG